MNKTDEQVAEQTVVRVLRATRANDAETAPARHSQQTPQCPHISRFAAVLKFGAKFTPEEEAHIKSGCKFCKRVGSTFAAAMSAQMQEETVHNLSAGAEDTVTGIGATKPKKPKKPEAPGDAPKPAS
jgi:hypothetical protein